MTFPRDFKFHYWLCSKKHQSATLSDCGCWGRWRPLLVRHMFLYVKLIQSHHSGHVCESIQSFTLCSSSLRVSSRSLTVIQSFSLLRDLLGKTWRTETLFICVCSCTSIFEFYTFRVRTFLNCGNIFRRTFLDGGNILKNCIFTKWRHSWKLVF